MNIDMLNEDPIFDEEVDLFLSTDIEIEKSTVELSVPPCQYITPVKRKPEAHDINYENNWEIIKNNDIWINDIAFTQLLWHFVYKHFNGNNEANLSRKYYLDTELAGQEYDANDFCCVFVFNFFSREDMQAIVDEVKELLALVYANIDKDNLLDIIDQHIVIEEDEEDEYDEDEDDEDEKVVYTFTTMWKEYISIRKVIQFYETFVSKVTELLDSCKDADMFVITGP